MALPTKSDLTADEKRDLTPIGAPEFARVRRLLLDNDGFAFATATLTIEVAPNGAPAAVDDAFAAGFGEALDVAAADGLLANDSDPDGDAISVVAFQQAANGELSVFADGSFTYAPDAGFSGTETVLYTITDGFAFATATLTIEVAPEGGTGPNVVEGAPFQPRIEGTDGADVILIGSSRSTQVFGGDDEDIFVFGLTVGDGARDVAYVRDFQQGLDLIDLSGQGYSLRTLGGSSIVTLDAPDRDTLFVTGVTLTEADFTDAWTNRDPWLI